MNTLFKISEIEILILKIYYNILLCLCIIIFNLVLGSLHVFLGGELLDLFQI